MPKHGTIINSTTGQTSTTCAWVYDSETPLLGDYMDIDTSEAPALETCLIVGFKDDTLLVNSQGNWGRGRIEGGKFLVTNPQDTYLTPGDTYDLYDAEQGGLEGDRLFTIREGKVWMQQE